MLGLIIDFVVILNVEVDSLKDFIDRVYSGKKVITYENGTMETVTIEDEEDATVEGTPINRDAMMAIQGFQTKTIQFENGRVVETNDDGDILTTTFEGSKIVEEFKGAKTITRTIEYNENGVLTEVVE